MWLFTKYGFISVVLKRGDAKLTVRSRARADLDAIRAHYMPALGPTRKTPRNDYPYRAMIEPSDFEVGMARIAFDVNYDNFKAEVMETRGPEVEKVYLQVWGVLARNGHTLDSAKPKVKGGGKRRKLIV